MKKQYISPVSQVIVLDDEDILAGSPGFSDGSVGGGDAKAIFLDDTQLDFLDDITIFSDDNSIFFNED